MERCRSCWPDRLPYDCTSSKTSCACNSLEHLLSQSFKHADSATAQCKAHSQWTFACMLHHLPSNSPVAFRKGTVWKNEVPFQSVRICQQMRVSLCCNLLQFERQIRRSLALANHLRQTRLLYWMSRETQGRQAL